jgi:hypothetical protein
MRTILALCLLTATSCASLAPGPSETARAYADALREGRSIDAWRLLSATAREGMTFEAFEAALRARPDEVRALADTFAAARSDDGATASLELPDGERITLRSERGQWRLDPAALDFYPQNTPRQALRAYVRAYRRGRWEVLLSLATRDVRDRLARMASEGEGDGGVARTAAGVLQAAWTAQSNEVSQRVDALDQALTRGYAVEVAGERATMTYGPGAQLVARLVREDGRWFIEHTD